MDFVPWRVCRTILADLADNTVLRQRYSSGSIIPGRGTGGVDGVLTKQFTYHQLDSATNLVPSHRNDPFVFQHHVVATGITVGVIYCLLEHGDHGAVYDASSASIATPTDAHRVASLEAVATMSTPTQVRLRQSGDLCNGPLRHFHQNPEPL